jgi:hypothetical protein
MMSAEENLATCCGFFQVFGLLYFSVKKLTPSTIITYPTIGYTVYFFLLFTVLTTQMLIFAVMISKDFQESLSAKNALNYIMQYFLFIGLILILFTGFIQSYAATPKLKKIIANFMQISDIFRRDFQHNVDYRSIKNGVFRSAFMVYLMQTSLTILLVVYEMYHGNENVIVRALFGTFPICFLCMTIIKFKFFIISINCVLKEMIAISDKMFAKYSSTGILIVSKHEHVGAKIKSLKKILNLVFKNAELINGSMGCTLFIQFFVLVLAMTINGYRTFLVMVGKFPLEKYGGKCLFNFMIITLILAFFFPQVLPFH